MVAFSSGGHRGSLATVRTPLGCGSIRPGIWIGGGGVFIFAVFVTFAVINDSPPAPADVQVTHTTPTRRSALYAPLPVVLGVWGTRDLLPLLLLLSLLCAGLGFHLESTVSGPRSDNVQATQTMPALRPALFAPLFASSGD